MLNYPYERLVAAIGNRHGRLTRLCAAVEAQSAATKKIDLAMADVS